MMHTEFLKRLLVGVTLVLSAQSAWADEPKKPLGLRSFERHLLPLLKEHCAYCHSQKMGDIPFLVDSQNVEATYAMIKRYVDDFENPRASLLFAKGTQKTMAGEWISDELATAISKWWKGGENMAAWVGKTVTRSVRVPVLPDKGYGALKVPLASIDPVFEGDFFEVDMKELGEDLYQICRPRVRSQKHSVAVQGVHVVLNGALLRQSNAYASLAGVATSAEPLSDLCQTLPQASGIGVDQVGFAFEGISVSGSPLSRPSPEASQVAASIMDVVADLTAEKVFDEATVGLAARFVDFKASGETRTLQVQSTPVTQLQWYLAMKETPSYFKTKALCDDGSYPLPSENLPPMCKHHPVESISAKDVVSKSGFLAYLNSVQSEYFYRLLTSDEFLSLANVSGSRFPWGEESSDQYAWFKGSSGGRTHAVAGKMPTFTSGVARAENQALYDLFGNVAVMVRVGNPYYSQNYGPENVLRAEGVGFYNLNGSQDYFFTEKQRKELYDGVHPHKQVGLRLVRIPLHQVTERDRIEAKVFKSYLRNFGRDS